jgi:hypothetical protein
MWLFLGVLGEQLVGVCRGITARDDGQCKPVVGGERRGCAANLMREWLRAFPGGASSCVSVLTNSGRGVLRQAGGRVPGAKPPADEEDRRVQSVCWRAVLSGLTRRSSTFYADWGASSIAGIVSQRFAFRLESREAAAIRSAGCHWREAAHFRCRLTQPRSRLALLNMSAEGGGVLLSGRLCAALCWQLPSLCVWPRRRQFVVNPMDPAAVSSRGACGRGDGRRTGRGV